MTGKRRGRWWLTFADICAGIHRTRWTNKKEVQGDAHWTKIVVKPRYNAVVVKDPKRHRFLIELLPHSFHATFRAYFQQQKCSKHKLQQKAENKTWVIFWGETGETTMSVLLQNSLPWRWKILWINQKVMGVSKNSGTPKSSILIRFSIINHPFWGTPIFGNTLIESCKTSSSVARRNFFFVPQKWRVQWGGGIPCQHLFKRYGNRGLFNQQRRARLLTRC